MQQNVDIPQVNLVVHPVVATIAESCLKERRKPRTEDYDQEVQDSNFLNQLQSGVNKWIKEIQNVST